MNKEFTEQKIKQLRQEIEKHDVLYEMNQPIITDTEYDKLYSSLVELEKENPEFYDPSSPTQRITYELVESLEKVRHSSPMQSLEKATTRDAVLNFCNKSSDDIIVEDKFDGLTIVLTYENGLLSDAVSRGNGIIGERVLHTIKTVKKLPKKIPFKGRLEVRGEALISFDDFERINVNGDYSNTRNLASGSVRQLDASIAAERNIEVYVYDLKYAEGIDFKTDSEMLNFLRQQGFITASNAVFKNTADGREKLLNYIHYYGTDIRRTLPYAIDGMVLKFNGLEVREKLGTTNKFPRWGLAYKFESEDAVTTLRSVEWQIGKSGLVTPVYVFDAIDIGGVQINRATGHNKDIMQSLGVKIGDKILVARANDVIPKVIKCFPELRDGSEKDIAIPKNCPECGSEINVEGPLMYCTGMNCAPQSIEKIVHFVSRDAMDINSLGSSSIQTFFNSGFLTNVVDIYRLKDHKDEITILEGFGDKKADKMFDAIEDSKKRPLSNVLYGLSILHLGRTNSKMIVKKYRNMDLIIEAAKNKAQFIEELKSMEGIGDIMAEAIADFFINEENVKLIHQLKDLGLTMEEQAHETGSLLAGKTFVITGTLSKDRNEFKKIIEMNGGKVTGSISKKTDFLLEGENAGSKHDKALELGIKIITEADLEGMLS